MKLPIRSYIGLGTIEEAETTLKWAFIRTLSLKFGIEALYSQKIRAVEANNLQIPNIRQKSLDIDKIKSSGNSWFKFILQ